MSWKSRLLDRCPGKLRVVACVVRISRTQESTGMVVAARHFEEVHRGNCDPTRCDLGKSECAWVWPTLESMRENLRDTRHKVTAARHATEDFAADTALKVRRHPLRAVSVAMFTGAVVGSLVGPCIGWFGRIRA